MILSKTDENKSWVLVFGNTSYELLEIRQLPTRQEVAADLVQRKKKRGDQTDNDFVQNPPFNLHYRLVPEQQKEGQKQDFTICQIIEPTEIQNQSDYESQMLYYKLVSRPDCRQVYSEISVKDIASDGADYAASYTQSFEECFLDGERSEFSLN